MSTDPMSRSIESVVPFRRSSEVREAREAAVTGELPAWLRGELVRTCPAVFEGAQWRARHWFDGLCLIYAFRIGASSVKFQSRLLESEAAHEIAGGPTSVSSFGTPTGRSWWQRALQPIQRITDNTNVNLVKFGDDLVALTEGDRQLRIDPASLGSLGALSYARDALTGSVASAHPHFDFRRQQVVNFATTFSAHGLVSVYEHGGAERTRRVVGSWRTRRVPYLHSFSLTPTRAILVAHPLLAKPLDMLWSNQGYIDHFEWLPEEGTRLVVIDRSTGRVVEYETDPVFVFHTVNAFERDGATVVDLLAYPDADIVYSLRVERMVEKLPDLRPSLLRLTLRPGQTRAQVEKLSDVGFEFPSTNYRRVNGSDYQFAWGASDGPHADRQYPSSLVKVDVRTGASSTFSDGEHVYGEPVFVARPGASDEDDGVLLSVGTAQRAESSAMAIVDARTMALVAKAELPQAIPLGFHGSFIRPNA